MSRLSPTASKIPHYPLAQCLASCCFLQALSPAARRAGRPRPALLGYAIAALLVVLTAVTLLLEWSDTAGSSVVSDGGARAIADRVDGFAAVAVLSVAWVPERVLRAKAICATFITSAPCHLVPGPRVKEADVDALVAAGYIEPYVPRRLAGLRDWWAARLDEPKHRLYQTHPTRIFRPTSIGNLVGLWSILARWLAAGATRTLLPLEETGSLGELGWLPPREGLKQVSATPLVSCFFSCFPTSLSGVVVAV